MKRGHLLASLLIGLMIMAAPGCTQNKAASLADKPAGEQGQKENSQVPHTYSDFQGSGTEFTGGEAGSNYDLSSLRRVPHPQFLRLVFEFTQADSGEVGAAPPLYRAKLETATQMNLRLKGIVTSDLMENKQSIISLSEIIKDVSYTRDNDEESVFTLHLNTPVTFQVFDLGNPARIVVVLKPSYNL